MKEVAGIRILQDDRLPQRRLRSSYGFIYSVRVAQINEKIARDFDRPTTESDQSALLPIHGAAEDETTVFLSRNVIV
jgi:hypothetical protein